MCKIEELAGPDGALYSATAAAIYSPIVGLASKLGVVEIERHDIEDENNWGNNYNRIMPEVLAEVEVIPMGENPAVEKVASYDQMDGALVVAYDFVIHTNSTEAREHFVNRIQYTYGRERSQSSELISELAETLKDLEGVTIVENFSPMFDIEVLDAKSGDPSYFGIRLKVEDRGPMNLSDNFMYAMLATYALSLKQSLEAQYGNLDVFLTRTT